MIRGHFDGASRGNPGPAGAGIVIYDDEKIIWRCAKPLGVHTNNEAEYMALNALAEELERRGLRCAEICGDSKLVISQVTGEWKIKEPHLKSLALPVIERLRSLGARYRWVPREQNAEADRLSNKALDEGKSFAEDLSGISYDNTSSPCKPKSENFVPERRISVLRASEKIWIVREGGEEFAVDLEHLCCTCEEGRNGHCHHVEAVLLKRSN